MWELKTARDLAQNLTFVRKGDYRASACRVTGAPVAGEDTVTFTARALWSRTTGEESVTLTPDQPVYVLTCTCNGMSFICNRWTFTGECSCVHIPLPSSRKEG